MTNDSVHARLATAERALREWTSPPAGLSRSGFSRPSSWLLEHAELLRPGGTLLDVACGRGRHALLLAGAGFHVHAVDRDSEAIGFLSAAARELGLDLTAEVMDLETDPPPDLGQARYDAVLVFNYLHRPLFPALRRALRTGGRLFYETFTVGQAERGRPRNPAFLLHAGELRKLVAPLVVRQSREGDVDGQCLASIVAERAT